MKSDYNDKLAMAKTLMDNSVQPEKPDQKFKRGCKVRIDKEMPGHMSHFTSDCDAIVEYTYAQKFPEFDPNDVENYSLILLNQDGVPIGSSAWYHEHQLTLINDSVGDGFKIIETFEMEERFKLARWCCSMTRKLNKLKPIIVTLMFIVLSPRGGLAQNVTLAWDANTEKDLAGYQIHYGFKTRTEVTGAIDAWCKKNEPEKLIQCKEEWENICRRDGQVDPACHSMLFGYENVVDVRTDTAGWSAGCTAPYDPFKAECCEYTLTDLVEDRIYYFAGVAYDHDGNKSAFSIELSHIVIEAKPDLPGGLRLRWK